MTQTFLAEAGVLLFVFPILDTVVTKGVQSITVRFAATSFGISFGLFLMAGVLALYNGGEPHV